MPTGRPVNQDDLKPVRGIGRKAEARLKEAGTMDLGAIGPHTRQGAGDHPRRASGRCDVEGPT